MKTGLQVLKDVESLLSVPAITGAINGGIYLLQAPVNSKRINIVIGLQGVNNDQLQQATVNVNIHLPNKAGLVSDEGDRVDNTRPDTEVLDTIVDLVIPFIENQYRADFFTEVNQPAMIFRDTDNTWYANIKVDYYSIQENYQNI